MSTEAKKAEALSSEEISGVVGGSKTSSNSTSGGPEFLVDPEQAPRRTEFLIDPDSRRQM